MGRLIHRTAPGFTYFVTTKTWENREVFQVTENAEILIECMLRYRNQGAYFLHEFVVMPNHLHVILTPMGDTSLEKAMQFVKGGSSHAIHKRRGSNIQVWQTGFHEESIRDQEDYGRKVEYIHMNPVHARLVDSGERWPYGSANKSFRMDAAPERLKIFSSGAKAPDKRASYMSELKLRPPKNLTPSRCDKPSLNPRAVGGARVSTAGAKAPFEASGNVGAKAPTP
jgi:putative transposase